MIWDHYEDIYKITITNNYYPFYYDKDKLYVIVNWSLGTVMKNANKESGTVITNKAEGKEIVSYGI